MRREPTPDERLLAQDFDDELLRVPLLDDEDPINDPAEAVAFGEWLKIGDHDDFSDFHTRLRIVRRLVDGVLACHEALAAKGGGLLFGSFKLVIPETPGPFPGTRAIAWNGRGFSSAPSETPTGSVV